MRTIRFFEEVVGRILSVDEIDLTLMQFMGDKYENLLGHGQSAALKSMVLP